MTDYDYENCWEALPEEILELINRQKTEIERLNFEIEEVNKIAREDELQALEENKENAEIFLQAIKQAKSEAIKEFAERLRNVMNKYILDYHEVVLKMSIEDDMDNLVKEMAESEGE